MSIYMEQFPARNSITISCDYFIIIIIQIGYQVDRIYSILQYISLALEKKIYKTTRKGNKVVFYPFFSKRMLSSSKPQETHMYLLTLTFTFHSYFI